MRCRRCAESRCRCARAALRKAAWYRSSTRSPAPDTGSSPSGPSGNPKPRSAVLHEERRHARLRAFREEHIAMPVRHTRRCARNRRSARTRRARDTCPSSSACTTTSKAKPRPDDRWTRRNPWRPRRSYNGRSPAAIAVLSCRRRPSSVRCGDGNRRARCGGACRPPLPYRREWHEYWRVRRHDRVSARWCRPAPGSSEQAPKPGSQGECRRKPAAAAAGARSPWSGCRWARPPIVCHRPLRRRSCACCCAPWRGEAATPLTRCCRRDARPSIQSGRQHSPLGRFRLDCGE